MRTKHLIGAVMLSAAIAAAAPAAARAEEQQGSQAAETRALGGRTGAEAGSRENGREAQAAGQEPETGEQQGSQAAEAWAAGGQESGRETESKRSRLIMLSGVERAQMLSVIICSENGSLVVVDGGWESDGEKLLETIKEYGGKVDAWLLTHPHSDHAGALCYILQNKRDEITIDNIYCSLAQSQWYWEVSPEDGPMADALMGELSTLPEGVVHDQVGKDFATDIDNLHITALNNRYQLSYDPVNNSSMVYMVDTGKEKILFLGDLGYMGGQFLVKDAAGKLKADIVQMAHHGQNGVDKEVYRAAAPRICLWPTPQWLWDNDNGGGYDSGSWRTIETRGWMEELGVEQNYSIKDGDIMLLLK